METRHPSTQPQPPVAIIGMGCLFPKAAGLKEYWRLLRHGQDAITEVPESHWSASDYYDSDPKKPDHIYCTRGGYLSPVSFDPSEFGIPPSTLEATDTSQLLGLVAANMALEDAGYGREREFNRERASVILGVTGTQELVIPLGARLGHPHWRRALAEAGVPEAQAEDVIRRISESYVPWQESSFPGLLGNVVAGRISNRLNLSGTNCAVDAACASSMSAMHLALMEIACGRVDMAVTGGVDCLNDIFMHMCFSKTPILSPTSDVRPFSEKADGTLLGEGVGILIFKRLEYAERDGDRIYAVIRALGSSSDGRSNSIYAPRAEGQMKALRMAYENAEVPPETVELVEAHGTGTLVGDEVEFKALSAIYSDKTLNPNLNGHRNRCAVGTVKSMIGHTKAAAGAAGLIKAALALHHKVLPPTLKAETADPRLHIEDSPFYLNHRPRPWFSSEDHPRRSAVSSFGFGGSNFHMVLEEYSAGKNEPSWDGSVEILALCGETSEAVETRLTEFRQEIADGLSSEDIARKAAASRSEFSGKKPYRLLMVIEKALDTFENLTETVSDALETVKNNARQTAWNIRNIFFGGPAADAGRLAFVFPGQGSQYADMGIDLTCCFPEAAETLECANHFSAYAGNGSGERLTDLIYPRPTADPREKGQQEKALKSTDTAQPAIGAVSVAMMKILRRFGILPDTVCGHSFGELCALHAAGRISEDDLFSLANTRGKLMAEAGGGAMSAVRAPIDRIEAVIASKSLDVTLANKNGPEQGVISGTRTEIEKAEQAFKALNIPFTRLPVSAAFHSPLMADAHRPYAEAVKQIGVAPSEIPVYSNITAMPYPDDPASVQKLLADQMLSPVDFVQEIRQIFETGVKTFVEVGPKPVLTGLVKAILKGFHFHALALDAGAGKRFGIADLARLLCHLAALGFPVELNQWESPIPEKRKQRMNIPISGANYRSSNEKKPKTPPEKSAPPLNRTQTGPSIQISASPKRQTTVKSSAPVLQPPVKQKLQAPKTSAPVNRKPATTINPSKPTEHKMNHTRPLHNSAVTGGNTFLFQDAFRAVQEGLKSMQSLQAQTAKTHERFLESQNQASRTLREMMESTRRLAEISMGSAPAEEFTVPSGRLPASELPASVLLPEKKTEIPEPADQTASEFRNPEPQIRTQEKPQTQPSVSASAPSPQLQSHEKEADESPAAAPNQHPRNNGGRKIEKTLMSVVSELTGYPDDMLSPDMEIEADLGIDSIKRVEILSAFEERMPNLPPVSPEIMGTLKTLGQIVEFLTGASIAKAPQTIHAETAPAVSASSAGPEKSRGEIQAALLSVVSDLTGYPEDMLSPDMEIEADLGIDSIKRVEILSAFEERMPELPPVSPEIMGTLKTLGQITEHLRGAVGSENTALRQTRPEETRSDEKGSEASPAPTPADTCAISETLLNVVSDLTGYPTDMLSPEMEIEADLGIDSIKRVEILSAFEERMPGLPPVSPEIMGTLKTLGQITEHLSRTESEAPPPLPGHQPEFKPAVESDTGVTVSDLPHPAVISSAEWVKKKVVTLVPRPSEPAGILTLPPEGRVRIIGLTDGLGGALARSLEHHGLQATVTGPDRNISEENICGLVLLSEAWTPFDRQSVKDAFALCRDGADSLLTSGKKSGAFLATVARMDGGFGFTEKESVNPYEGGLAGMTKTAGQEWETVSCRAFDLAPEWKDTDAAANALTAELLRQGPPETGLFPGKTLMPVPEEHPYPKTGSLNLSENDAVIITGGARGVTAAAALALAEAIPSAIVLLGRSPAPTPEPEWLAPHKDVPAMKRAILQNAFRGQKPAPADVERIYRKWKANREITETLERIRRTGAAVQYFSADVLDGRVIRRVLDQVRSQYGPVRALIHGAGILADKFIQDKTPEQFARVFDTKVKGLENLLQAASDDPLSYLILFSSVAARMGNPGQADYAAANEVLNKMARNEARHRPECRVISFNWGPWDGGMVTPSLKKEFERRGVELIPIDAGARSMIAEMRGTPGRPVEIVMGGGLSGSETVHHPAPQPAPTPVNILKQTELSMTLTRQVDVNRFPVLKDHMLDGKPVIPFALMAELLGHGALHGNPGLHLHGLNDMRLLKGIRLDEEPVPLRLFAGSATRNGDHYEVDVEIRDGHRGDVDQIHSRAKAILKDIPAFEPQDYHPSLDIQLKSYPRSMREVYQEILFHGKSLHGIREIMSCSPKGMVALLTSAPPPSDWMKEPLRTRWLSDPLILDAAFQMAIVWCHEEKGMPCLPSFGARYRQYARLPEDGVTAILEVRETTRRKMRGDYSFLNREGKRVASLEGYEAVLDSSLRRAFRKTPVQDFRPELSPLKGAAA